MVQLSIRDHRRDSAGMTYVYPVLSRRAGGVSVGINLNPNNACNWRCIYCQVPDLTRGGPPPLDLARLETELRGMLRQLYAGDYLEKNAPPEARRVVDVAFSGNGEPTSAREFADAVLRVGRIVDEVAVPPVPPVRLITNGSLLDRDVVQRGISTLGARDGEVWFKVDVVGMAAMRRINGIAIRPDTLLRRLRRCGELCPTWVQTCWFALDDWSPSEREFGNYLDLLKNAADRIAGIHLYGLARPSMQTEAPRLSALPAEWLQIQAGRIRDATGLTVRVSP